METLSIVTLDGVRDLSQMDRALRLYRAARLEMAVSSRPVSLFDEASRETLRLETMNDMRMLLYAAAAAYRGARSAGLADVAESLLTEIQHELQRA